MKTMNERELRKQISHHWGKVKEGKAAILALYDEGTPITSPKYIELSRQVDRHGAELMALDRQLEDLILAQA